MLVLTRPSSNPPGKCGQACTACVEDRLGHREEANLAKLIHWVEASADISMPELSAKLEAETGVGAHPASLSRALIVAGFRYKKSPHGVGMRTR